MLANQKYLPPSASELAVMSMAQARRQWVITPEFIFSIFKEVNQTYKVFRALKENGRLLRIDRARYVLAPCDNGLKINLPHPWVMARLWMDKLPYYIGYLTMYKHWGFSSKEPDSTFVLNPLRSRLIAVGAVRLRGFMIDPLKFYGLTKVRVDAESVCISDKERTLVDFIEYPGGDYSEVPKVLRRQLKQIDLEKFIHYLVRFPNLSLRRRGGYSLGQLGVSAQKLRRLKNSLGPPQYVALNPFSGIRKGKINKEWGIIENLYA